MKIEANQLLTSGKVVAQAIGVGLVYLGAVAVLTYPVVTAAVLGA